MEKLAGEREGGREIEKGAQDGHPEVWGPGALAELHTTQALGLEGWARAKGAGSRGFCVFSPFSLRSHPKGLNPILELRRLIYRG